MSFYTRKPDLIIRNGTIADGTGQLAYFADLAVVGDKIDYIGDLKGVDAPLVIDAHHKYVTPGFIDTHTHSDWAIWANPEAWSAVMQGVTTEVVGNCGFSGTQQLEGIPFDPAGDGIECVYDLSGPNPPAGSMAATLDKMDKMGSSINTAWFCGHNDLRMMADLYTTDYTEEQFKVMADLLREAMEAGFIGFSTGLEFVPGIVSRPEEVERLAMIAAEYDGNYATHMRDEGTYILEAINEFLNVIRKTGLRGTVSHLNVKYDNGIPNDYLHKGMQMLKDVRSIEHLNVYADMLPTCFATGGALAILPPWLYANGWDEARKLLKDPVARQRIRRDCNRYWRFLAAGQWDRLLYVQPHNRPEISVTRYTELMKRTGKDGFDLFFDILAEAATLKEARSIHMQGTVFHEQTMIDSVVQDPIYLWQTDSMVTKETGPLAERFSNVQNYMSMTYFFAHYVRDVSAISLEKALPKVSSIPARHYMLNKRGILAEGYYADINVFALEELRINSTFADPCRYSSGMDYVIVNGRPVIAQGKHTLDRAGRVLRHKK
ncbi:MAG: amidohydrolase family protein [Bacillota bacterium]|nr:amidohydrolase family protein [Bacillota bacterium]